MYAAFSGATGLNGEPNSIVNDDLIAQNILIAAYNEPITISDLSKAVGIPAAYTEPIVHKLIYNQLMKQIGNKVYTDFILYTVEDRKKYIPAQKQLVQENSELFLRSIKSGLSELRRNAYYLNATADQRNSLEMYLVLNSVQKGVYAAFSEIYNTVESLPDRPNGGKWIASGNVITQKFHYRDHLDLVMHDISGERHSYLENYLGAELELFVYDPAFPINIYYHGEKGIGGVHDEDLLKLLSLIERGINPEKAGFNAKLLQSIPWLVECKILNYDNGNVKISIPVLSKKEKTEIWEIFSRTQKALKNDLKHLLADFIKDKKQAIPKYLTSVPLFQQYRHSMHALPMAVLRCAMYSGLLYDGGYVREEQCPYPMIFVTDKAV